jgi:hypothetical protein
MSVSRSGHLGPPVTASVPRLILRPLQSFRRTEEACGILLLAIAVAALVSATSPWRPT